MEEQPKCKLSCTYPYIIYHLYGQLRERSWMVPKFTLLCWTRGLSNVEWFAKQRRTYSCADYSRVYSSSDAKQLLRKWFPFCFSSGDRQSCLPRIPCTGALFGKKTGMFFLMLPTPVPPRIFQPFLGSQKNSLPHTPGPYLSALCRFSPKLATEYEQQRMSLQDSLPLVIGAASDYGAKSEVWLLTTLLNLLPTRKLYYCIRYEGHWHPRYEAGDKTQPVVLRQSWVVPLAGRVRNSNGAKQNFWRQGGTSI